MGNKLFMDNLKVAVEVCITLLHFSFFVSAADFKLIFSLFSKFKILFYKTQILTALDSIFIPYKKNFI